MRRSTGLAVILLVLTWGRVAQGAALFTEDFEGDLSIWTGKGMGAHHGLIVGDPSAQTDRALTFTSVAEFGDIFSVAEFSAGTYTLQFDYYGVDPGGAFGSNGFIGISDGFPLAHNWLAGTWNDGSVVTILADDVGWQTYAIPFAAAYDFHIMIEDFLNQPAAGNAFFDNVVLFVPEPTTALLLAAGIIGLAMRRTLIPPQREQEPSASRPRPCRTAQTAQPTSVRGSMFQRAEIVSSPSGRAPSASRLP